MFSIFHGIFTLFALGIDHHNKTSQNYKNKERAKKSGSKTYYGSRGNEYLVENDKWVSTKFNPEGEKVIADMKTGQVYYNLTKEKKKEKEKEILEQGETVRYKMYNEQNNSYYGKYRQMYGYIDIATGHPVKEIVINNIHFYIDLETALILRPIDNVDLQYLVGVWGVNDLIEIINERQKKLINEIKPNERSRVNKELFYNNHFVYIDKEKNVHLLFRISKSKELVKLYIKDGLKYSKEEGKWI